MAVEQYRRFNSFDCYGVSFDILAFVCSTEDTERPLMAMVVVVVVVMKMVIMKEVLVGAFTLKLIGYGNGLGGGVPQSALQGDDRAH
jgi:hypothetical protein